jgi:hypothetical protein
VVETSIRVHAIELPAACCENTPVFTRGRVARL